MRCGAESQEMASDVSSCMNEAPGTYRIRRDEGGGKGSGYCMDTIMDTIRISVVIIMIGAQL